MAYGDAQVTADLYMKVTRKFPLPEWVVLPEVADGTGSYLRRWADALAMNMYPSRGLTIVGFEIKASRSDWMRELKDPTKSAPVQKYCDHWYVVAPKGIVSKDELPSTWGLLEPYGKGLRATVAAPKLEAATFSRIFAASLMRSAQKARADVAELHSEYERGKAEGTKLAEERARHKVANAEEAIKKVREFEEASGVKIDTWDVRNIGEAVRIVLDAKRAETYFSRALEQIEERLQQMLGGIKEVRDGALDG